MKEYIKGDRKIRVESTGDGYVKISLEDPWRTVSVFRPFNDYKDFLSDLKAEVFGIKGA